MSKVKTFQLTMDEHILFEVIQAGCVSVRINRKKELVIEPGTAPEYLVPRRILKINVQEALNRLAETRLWYSWENSRLYILEPPKVRILPFELRAERFEKNGSLVITVDGEEAIGYTEIAQVLFGGYTKDLIPDLKKPLRENFDLQEIVFVKMKKVRNRKVAVYRWRGYDLVGITALQKKMFWLSEDDLERLKRLATENKISLGEHRADQLVRLFDLSYEDGEYVMTDPSDQRLEIKFKYKKQVLEYIRHHEAGGTVSREVSKQMFETVEGETKWE